MKQLIAAAAKVWRPALAEFARKVFQEAR